MLRRLTVTGALCVVFLAAFAGGKGHPAMQAPLPVWADSLRATYLYTEGIKLNAIEGDSARARELFQQAIRADSSYAPAYFSLAANGMYSTPNESVELAGAAFRLDTTNKWYHQFYGQTLVYAQRYSEALRIYRQLLERNPSEPDNYRLVAALYEQQQQPYSAIATLDSAELRFGRIPMLSGMKRQLLIATRQVDKALAEAQALAISAPYDADHHAALGELYGATGQDSLALVSFNRALQIDSTDIRTLMSVSDYHGSRHDYRSQLSTIKELFRLDAFPLSTKLKLFDRLTSDVRFYRDNYFQLNELATTLAIRHASDPRVVTLYARHQLASGQPELALTHYKLHLHDTPPIEEYFRSVIEIESYLQRTDSVNLYVTRALELFPSKPDFHIFRGHAMSYQGEHSEAIKAYRRSLKYVDSDSLRSVTWGFIGDAWHQKAVLPSDKIQPSKPFSSREMKRAYRAYDQSLRYDASNASVLNNYAYFLSVEGVDLEKALAMSSRATELSQGNPTFLDTHAWVLFRLGRLPQAKKIMQQALALDTHSSSELLVHYGDILHALGEQFLAESYWKNALEKGYDAESIERRLSQPRNPVPAK